MKFRSRSYKIEDGSDVIHKVRVYISSPEPRADNMRMFNLRDCRTGLQLLVGYLISGKSSRRYKGILITLPSTRDKNILFTDAYTLNGCMWEIANAYRKVLGPKSRFIYDF